MGLGMESSHKGGIAVWYIEGGMDQRGFRAACLFPRIGSVQLSSGFSFSAEPTAQALGYLVICCWVIGLRGLGIVMPYKGYCSPVTCSGNRGQVRDAPSLTLVPFSSFR